MTFVDQIQRQLFSRPMSPASDIRPFAEGRAVIDPARSVATRTLPTETDTIGEVSIGLNPTVSMSSSRDTFLGHACVSPLSSEAQSEAIGSDDVQNLFAGSANGHG